MVSGAEKADGQGGASGVLTDVFQITGRGTVGAIEGLEGTVSVGDLAHFPDGHVAITGVEMIGRRDPAKITAGHIGLLFGGVEKADLLPLVGTRIAFSREDA